MDAALDALFPALAAALLHSLWQIALLGLTASLIMRAMARASAAARHALGIVFLAAMLVMPAAQVLASLRAHGTTHYEPLLPFLTSPDLGLMTSMFARTCSPLAPLVVLVWLVGVALMGLRHFAGLRAVRVMERGPFQALPHVWQQRVDELRRAMGIARAVAVHVTDDVLTPCAARLLRPIIWVPLSLLTRTPAEQLEALLAHELAHIARRDWLWNGIQCTIETLLFFHPAVWWLSRRVRQEREHACDDMAVTACGDAIALAEALAALECERQATPAMMLAADGGFLLRRVARLLSTPPTRGHRGIVAALGALTMVVALLAVQVGMAGDRWPDLQVRASTSGPLGPGDFREIRARDHGRHRFYRASLGACGRLSETYEENGHARVIDPEIRRWLEDVSSSSWSGPQSALPMARDQRR